MKLPPITKQAFTLIELLIVVAIIAILAAIAVPNFLEAQVRAKTARAKADHRTIHTALETYRIDLNTYPLMNAWNQALCPPSRVGSGQFHYTLERLTTPIAYLSGGGVFTDPFSGKSVRRLSGAVPTANEPERLEGFKQYFYAVRGLQGGRNVQEHLQWGDSNARPSWGLLQSSGPQQIKWYFGSEINQYLAEDNNITRGVCYDMIYDPTNGTVSAGTIVRVFGEPSGRGSVLGKAFMSVQ